MRVEHVGIERNEREGCLDSQLDWNLNSDAYIREEQVYIWGF